MELDKRKQLILAAIVEKYIALGEPVGSRAVAAKLDNLYSSATIRNEMAALTEMNLLEQPHTSAGRIPSYLGYRFYVDHLMSRKPLSKKERRTIDDVFVNVEVDVEKFLGRISGALALMTNCVSLTTTPVSKAAIFSSIELIPLGRRTFILIFVTAPGIVRDKICRLDAEPGSELCERFIKAVNEQLCRTSVENITPAFIQTLGITLGELGLLFSPVLYEIYKAAQAVLEGRIILEGCTNLLAHREFAGDPKAVMDFLGRQDILRDMLIRNNESTSVIIGSELGGLNNMPIGFIVSKYSVKGDTAGSVGIIGPSRLDYSKIIPYIEYFAELMGKLLTDALNENEE